MADGRSLPKELELEIMLYLPVKSLVRFTCVSRHWYSLITSPSFVTTHHRRQRKDQLLITSLLVPPPNKNYVLSLHNFGHDDDRYLALFMHRQPDLLVSLIQFVEHLPDHLYCLVEVPDTSHGVVCMAIPDCGRPYKNKFVLANPALMQFKHVPNHPFVPPEGYTFCPSGLGFGFDPDTNDFKILLLEDATLDDYEDEDEDVMDLTQHWALLYHCRTDSWSLISQDVVVPLDGYVIGSCVNINGGSTCHWNALSVILTFHVTSEAFGHVDWPYDSFDQFHHIHLAVLDECLAVVLYHYGDEVNEPQHIKIWVMKEYGIMHSWTKLYVIGPHVLSRPLIFLKNDWLLVENHEGELEAFSLSSNETKRFPTIGGTLKTLIAVMYKESLISLLKPSEQAADHTLPRKAFLQKPKSSNQTVP